MPGAGVLTLELPVEARPEGARPPLRRRRRAWALALAPVVGLGLTACTADDPDPAPVVDALAEGLAAGTVDDVAFTDDLTDAAVTKDREALFGPLGDVDATVTASTPVVTDSNIQGEPTTATATLDWSWDLGTSTPWTYTTDVALTLVETPDADAASQWQVDWDRGVLLPEVKDGDTLTSTRVAAERAGILGASDEPIVVDRPVNRVGIDKTMVSGADQETSARVLADLVGSDPDAYAAQVEAAGDKAFVQAIVVRKDDTETLDLAAARAIPGVNVVADTMPLAPTREFARPILGTAGPATAEIVEASGGAVVAGDTAGLSGLQEQYDAQLRGTPGLTVSVEPASGDPREVFRVDPVEGTPLRTTLVPRDQQAAEDVLADVGPASALVAIDVPTGDVVAAASGPGSDGLSTATLGTFAPGSTFKVASTLGMLRAGLTPASTVECPATLTVDGRTFKNVPGYPEDATGSIPLSVAFANSCNTAMIGQRDVVSQQDLHDAAADLGLGVPVPAFGAPAAWGTVPTTAGETEHAASMIGQGKIEASPLAMARLAASVAAGERVDPVLVMPAASDPADVPTAGAAPTGAATSTDAATAGAGATAAPTEPPASNLTSDESKTLHELMRGVVTDGSADVLADLPGDLAAKTGTAQYGDGTRAHAWMIAIDDDLAVAVLVADGEFGSTTAGPLVHAFLEAVG